MPDNPKETKSCTDPVSSREADGGQTTGQYAGSSNSYSASKTKRGTIYTPTKGTIGASGSFKLV